MRDTVPAALKSQSILFANKSPPNLTTDYDVLGFDADHCLVKYNIPNLATLLSEITSKDLHEQLNYPQQIRDVPEALNAISLNNTVWDIEHRMLLKLGEGKLVVQANKGSTKMTREEIEAVYGCPAIFQPLNYPNTNK